MTGSEAISYIHSFSWLGSRPGLSRTRELLERLGHPEEQLKFIHVVGTNGKGSVSAFLASVLRAAGYRTGLYTSPYISRFHERMQVDGVPISDETLARVVEAVKPHAEAMTDHPTEFELVTAAGLLYFQQEGCDIVVLEAGLGGRLDSTNAIPSPEVVAVTRIGLDHTEQLGHTPEAIAGEKAGVIKAGCHVALYCQEPSVMAVFEAACRERGAELRVTRPDGLRILEQNLEVQRFDYPGFPGLGIALLGLHQTRNAAVALEALLALRERGWDIPDAAVYQGLAAARWPGRFEILSRDPWFVVDGGHNPQCVQAAADALRFYFPGKLITFLIGVLADKDYGAMADLLAPMAAGFVTVTPDSPRALPAGELAALLAERYGLPAQPCGSVEEGVDRALALAGSTGVACALGSLYMTGKIRAHFGLVDIDK